MTKRVLCDMDGCLVDILPEWLNAYGFRTGEYIHHDTISAYGHEQFVSDKDAFWAALPDALENATPVTGSSVFNAIYNHCDVYVVTYCHPAACRDAMHVKTEWMKRYFPLFDTSRMVFTGAKHVVSGDYLIEDCNANIEAWEAANPRGQGLLMNAPYNNSNVSYSWAEIAALLGV